MFSFFLKKRLKTFEFFLELPGILCWMDQAVSLAVLIVTQLPCVGLEMGKPHTESTVILTAYGMFSPRNEGERRGHILGLHELTFYGLLPAALFIHIN